MRNTQGEPRVLISRAALQHNAALIRRALSPETKLCAVIKADAYGLGLEEIAHALTREGCRTAGRTRRPRWGSPTRRI